MNIYMYILIFALSSISLFAQESEDGPVGDSLNYAQALELYQAYTDSLLATFHYEMGLIHLKDDLATIQVPSGFKYLNGQDAERVLTDLWGNPPNEEADRSLGMLFPEESNPLDDHSYAIDITYSEEGYIEDEDADEIDYDDLLDEMKEQTKETNDYRLQQGYESVELIGWASEPYYDQVQKKLHWAKELKFGEMEDHTLNYNIRVLGRRGYLQLNVIGGMDVLESVKENIDEILPSVEFKDGNRYSDFDPGIDKVAAYGLTGLIAGKLLAKAGLLAKFGIVFAKFWKVIMVAFVALGAGIKKFFAGKKGDENPA